MQVQMTRYVLVDDTTKAVLQEVEGDKEFRTGSPPDLPLKPFSWLPLVIVNPPVDWMTEVKEDPFETVTDTEVTRTWVVRAKTAEELSNEKEKEIDRHLSTPGMVAFLQAFDDDTIQPGQKIGLTNLKALIKGA
jgi:hypothetical protein